MRVSRTLLVTGVLSLACAYAQSPTTAEDPEERDKRQTQAYYTGGLGTIRATAKPQPQPFSPTLQQTAQPRFQGLLSSAPQGFRTVTPVEDESEDIDRNTVSPTPQPLVHRTQHQQQQPSQVWNTIIAAKYVEI